MPLRTLLAPLAVAVVTALPAAAQHTDTLGRADAAERLLEAQEASADGAEQLAEWLADLADDPLDLNTADVHALARLPGVGPLRAHAILRHRAAHGPFSAARDVLAVDGIDEPVWAAMRPFVTARRPGGDPAVPPRFPRPSGWRAVWRDGRAEVIQRATRRLDVGRGYTDDTTRTTYRGSPARLYTRLRVRTAHAGAALVLEKDPGEPMAWGPGRGLYGYDHAAGHLAVRDLGRLRLAVLGDYVVQAGQGLLLWRGAGFGKGRDAIGPAGRVGRGVAPYASSDENRFFRGAAATVALTRRLQVSGFASRRRLDASLGAADTRYGVTSLAAAGLHRTPTEAAQRDALGETLVGGLATWRGRRAQVGVAGYAHRYDADFLPSGRPDRAALPATPAGGASVFGSVAARRVTAFGEAARDGHGTLAGIAGLQLTDGRVLDAVVLVRHYPAAFLSMHGHAFGERNGATQNEQGVYAGMRLRPRRGWTLSAYADHYRFPWLRFGVGRPSTGRDVRVVAEHRPRAWVRWYLQVRAEHTEEDADVPAPVGTVVGLAATRRHSARLHGDYRFSPRLRLRARLDAVRARHGGDAWQHGTLLYGGLRWAPAPWLQVDARALVFDAYVRVYAYEHDLLYTFALPSFAGRGQRSYALLRLQPVSRLTIQLKYGVTRYEDIETTGSGLEETAGPRVREVRLQIRWRR